MKSHSNSQAPHHRTGRAARFLPPGRRAHARLAPEQAGAHRRAHRRQHQRRAGAPGRARAAQGIWPALRRREQTRCGRQHRRAGSDSRAAPDGHTLLMGYNGPLAINVTLFDKMPYDPTKDLAPITLAVKAPQYLVVTPAGRVHQMCRTSSPRPRPIPPEVLLRLGGHGQRLAPDHGDDEVGGRLPDDARALPRGRPGASRT